MESKITNQKDEIREHLNKIESLSEDMEKVQEDLAVTKDSLTERNIQLKSTTETLTHTEHNLARKRKECDETAYLLDEQVKTETKLFEEATALRQVTIEQHNDCTRLHEKIDRCNTVAVSNMYLTDQFAKHMHEKIIEFAKYDMHASSAQETSLCNVCDALQEVNSRMEDMKTENVCQLNIYEQKQQNWLKLRRQFLNSEIKDNFEAFYKLFLTHTSQSSSCSSEAISQQLSLCSSHSTMFTETYNQLTKAIEASSTQNESFIISFIQNSEKFLSNTDTSIQKSSVNITQRVQALEESVSVTSSDLSDLKSMTHDFKSNINTALTQLTKTISEKSSQLSKVLNKVIQSNEKQTEELQAIKQIAEINANDCLAKKNSEYNDLVSEPVCRLLEANKKSLLELSTFTKALNTNYTQTAAHFESSLKDIKEIESSQEAKLNELTIAHSEKLVNQCNVLNDELVKYASESERFFHNFNSNSIEAELVDLIDLTGHAQHEVKITTTSVDERKEHAQEHAAELSGAVETFAVKEYEAVLPTGQTPLKKSFTPVDEPKRTRDHIELIESYRQRLNELDEMLPPAVVEPMPMQKTTSEIDLTSHKMEVGYPLKRVASEKENALNDKQASKMSKNGYGSARSTVASKPRRAFGASN